MKPLNDKAHQAAASSQSWRGVLPWLILGAWFLVQFCLFYQYLQREILWAFPGHWDQVRYLQESHDLYRNMAANGLLHGLLHAFLAPTPTGNLLCTEAAVLYLFLGTSRLTALLVLFAYWILFQSVAVDTVRWLSRRWSLAVVGLALLLLAASPFRREGSLLVFQIDFADYCTFGILLCLVIRSNIFENRRLCLLVSLVAGYMVILRFITMAYLGVICCDVLYCSNCCLSGSPTNSRNKSRQNTNAKLPVGQWTYVGDLHACFLAQSILHSTILCRRSRGS